MSAAHLYAEAARRAVGTALAHIDAGAPQQTTALANVHDCISAFARDHGANANQCIEAQARSLALLIHSASFSPADAAEHSERAARIMTGALAIFQHEHPTIGGTRT